MKYSDKLKYVCDNKDKSVKEIAHALNITTKAVCSLARSAGVVLEGQRVYCDRSFCDPPFSCGECPFPDCINSQPATIDETNYVESALGNRRRGITKAVIV